MNISNRKSVIYCINEWCHCYSINCVYEFIAVLKLHENKKVKIWINIFLTNIKSILIKIAIYKICRSRQVNIFIVSVFATIFSNK